MPENHFLEIGKLPVLNELRVEVDPNKTIALGRHDFTSPPCPVTVVDSSFFFDNAPVESFWGTLSFCVTAEEDRPSLVISRLWLLNSSFFKIYGRQHKKMNVLGAVIDNRPHMVNALSLRAFRTFSDKASEEKGF